MAHLSLRAFELVAKKAGAKRVSKDALEEMREAIEEIALEVCEQSARMAKHAGRNTVRKEDIEFVIGKEKAK